MDPRSEEPPQGRLQCFIVVLGLLSLQLKASECGPILSGQPLRSASAVTGEPSAPGVITSTVSIGADLKEIVDLSKSQCHIGAECTAEVVERSLLQSSKNVFSKVYTNSSILVRRVLVTKLWLLSFALPGFIVSYAAEFMGVDDRTSGVLVATSAGAIGSILVSLGAPIVERISPIIRSTSVRWWHVNEGDYWGHTVEKLPYTKMTVADYAGGLIVAIDSNLQAHGQAVALGQTKKAATALISAILIGYDLFNGANMTHSAVIVKVRSHIDDYITASRSVLKDIPQVAHDLFLERTDLQPPDGFTRVAFAREIKQIADIWLLGIGSQDEVP